MRISVPLQDLVAAIDTYSFWYPIWFNINYVLLMLTILTTVLAGVFTFLAIAQIIKYFRTPKNYRIGKSPKMHLIISTCFILVSIGLIYGDKFSMKMRKDYRTNLCIKAEEMSKNIKKSPLYKEFLAKDTRFKINLGKLKSFNNACKKVEHDVYFKFGNIIIGNQ